MRALVTQLTRFGLVGLVGLAIDVGVFNLLRATVFSPENLAEGPFLAKVVSTSLAIAANWVGNRYWTFNAERGTRVVREGIEFALVSIAGMGISLLCLWISHYVLGFKDVVSDNISSNVVGLALGTAFRFTFYRLWVFNPRRTGSGTAESPVRPSGGAPLGRVQTIATVEDRANRDD